MRPSLVAFLLLVATAHAAVAQQTLNSALSPKPLGPGQALLELQ